MSKNKIYRELERISNHHPWDIEGHVAREALDRDCPETFFSDLLSHGCVCGMVGSLVYYYDTHAFFDRHYDEIEEMREEFEKYTGEALSIRGDLKNHLAWWAFEARAWEMAQELGLD